MELEYMVIQLIVIVRGTFSHLYFTQKLTEFKDAYKPNEIYLEFKDKFSSNTFFPCKFNTFNCCTLN